MQEAAAAPAFAPRLPAAAVVVWCVSTAFAASSLNLYLFTSHYSTFKAFSEQPWWFTLLVVVAGLTGLALGYLLYRRGGVLARSNLALSAFLCFFGIGSYISYVYIYTYTLPVSVEAPEVGEPAPDFRLLDPDGRAYSLPASKGRPTLLVFFRAHW